MSRPNRRKNNKKKRGTSGASTPTVSDMSSSGAQASGGEGGGGAAQESNGSLPLSSNKVVGTASEVPLGGEQFNSRPVAGHEEPKPSPRKNPEPSPQNDKASLRATPVERKVESPGIPALAGNQDSGKPVQSSAVKKTTIEEGAPTATAATSSAAGASEASKDLNLFCHPLLSPSSPTADISRSILCPTNLIGQEALMRLSALAPTCLSAAVFEAILLGSLSSVSAIAVSPSLDCRRVTVDGYTYDLSSLNKEWTIEGRIPLRFNPCAPLAYYNEACPYGSSYMCAMDPAAPQTGRANVGVPTELYKNPKQDLVVLYTRGSYDLNGFPFISLVRFECDQKAVGNGPLEPVADGSKYFLIWKTKAACPVSTFGVGSGGGFFANLISWIIVGLLLYLIVGYLYNLLIIGKGGREAIPNYGFWAEVGSFFSELFTNLKAHLSGSGGGYQQI